MSEKTVVGIDVSKAFSDICILSPNNDVIKRMKISNDIIGIEWVRRMNNIQNRAEEIILTELVYA